MHIITLTTDFGLKDHSVSAVKGAIFSEIPNAVIVDVTHLITPFNIIETAYILKNSYINFPKGTIHIIGVNAELSPINRHLAIEFDGHFFICADNGIISLLSTEIAPSKVTEITISNSISSFPTLDTFTKVACHIARGGSLSVIGKETQEYKKLTQLQPEILSKEKIIARVIYIDNYNNVITNISKSFFEKFADGRKFVISFNRYNFTKIHSKYNDIVDYTSENTNNYEGKRLALFNSEKMLEIAIYKGNSETGGASSLLGISYGSTISIEFFEKEEIVSF